MNVILIIGWKPSPEGPQPECLYCGLDGDKAEAASDAACHTGQFVKIGRAVNLMFASRAHEPWRKPTPEDQPAAESKSSPEPKRKK